MPRVRADGPLPSYCACRKVSRVTPWMEGEPVKDPFASSFSIGKNHTYMLNREDRSMMTRLVTHLVEFLQREDGPTAVEYAVMLALIIVVCIAAITALGSNAQGTFTYVGNTVATAS